MNPARKKVVRETIEECRKASLRYVQSALPIHVDLVDHMHSLEVLTFSMLRDMLDESDRIDKLVSPASLVRAVEASMLAVATSRTARGLSTNIHEPLVRNELSNNVATAIMLLIEEATGDHDRAGVRKPDKND